MHPVLTDKFVLLMNEGNLVAEMLAQGATYLSKVHKSENTLYYHVFNNLSRGLERLLKLILITSAVYNHQEITSKQIRKYGHDLLLLKEKVIEITKEYPKSKFDINRINKKIHNNILKELNEFSKNKRYYNIDKLGNKHYCDPVISWEKNVINYIIDENLNKFELKFFVDDMRSKQDLNLLSTQEMTISVGVNIGPREKLEIEKNLRLYVMQIIREFASFLVEISDLAWVGNNKNEHIPFFRESYYNLIQKDNFYKSHKTYSMYGV